MKLKVSRGRFGVVMILIDRDDRVESSEIIESRVSRSLFPSSRTCRVLSIGFHSCVLIENVILTAAAVACVNLMFAMSSIVRSSFVVVVVILILIVIIIIILIIIIISLSS